MNPLLENDLNSALRGIDERIYESARDRLRVNQPDHKPTPRIFVPSHSPLKP